MSIGFINKNTIADKTTISMNIHLQIRSKERWRHENLLIHSHRFGLADSLVNLRYD